MHSSALSELQSHFLKIKPLHESTVQPESTVAASETANGFFFLKTRFRSDCTVSFSWRHASDQTAPHATHREEPMADRMWRSLMHFAMLQCERGNLALQIARHPAKFDDWDWFLNCSNRSTQLCLSDRGIDLQTLSTVLHLRSSSSVSRPPPLAPCSPFCVPFFVQCESGSFGDRKLLRSRRVVTSPAGHADTNEFQTLWPMSIQQQRADLHKTPWQLAAEEIQLLSLPLARNKNEEQQTCSSQPSCS